MRVLITTDVVGGVWTYTTELVDALARRGHRLALVAFGGYRNRAQREWTGGRPWLDFTCVPCPLEWMPEPEPELSESVAALRRHADRFQPDIIHLNQFFYGAHDLGAPKLVVAHSDVVTWWREVKGEDPPDDPWFTRYRGWVKAGLEGAAVRAAPSAWLASRVREMYGGGPVRAVHNARSPERFSAPVAEIEPAAAAEPAAATELAAISERAPRRILSAGRLWDEAKGARDLIPAGSSLGSAAEIVVAGAVEHPGGGEDFPAAADGIHHAGRLDPRELAALYASADVYAATSRYEPFGLAPLEAALAGCALVMTDIPTFRELWTDCAIFYPSGNANALAEALSRVLQDHSLRRELAATANNRALKKYGPERMAHEYESLYSKAISAPARSPRSLRSLRLTKGQGCTKASASPRTQE